MYELVLTSLWFFVAIFSSKQKILLVISKERKTKCYAFLARLFSLSLF